MQRLLLAYIVNPKDIEIFRRAQDIQITQFPMYAETAYAFSNVNGLVPTMRTVNTGAKDYDKASVAEYALDFARKTGFQYVALLEPNMVVTGHDNVDPHGMVECYRMKGVECATRQEINSLYRGGLFSPKKEELSGRDCYIYNITNKTLNVNKAVDTQFHVISLVEKPVVNEEKPKAKLVAK